jgi:serine/threonine protein phosphatase 1
MNEVLVSPWFVDDRLQPGDVQVFAVGDVHGHPGTLTALVDRMAAEAGERSHLVLLGDEIDRGPDSLGAIVSADAAMHDMRFTERTLLMGNHDLFFHGAVADLRRIRGDWTYADNGGQKVLKALRGAEGGPHLNGATIRALAVEKTSPRAIATYEAALTHLEIGNLFLVHAGLNPGYPIARHFVGPVVSDRYHYEEDLHWAWVRLPFLRHCGPFEGGRVVVHGHTPEVSALRWMECEIPDGIHRLCGWRLGLDGSNNPDPAISGAQIETGRYRIFRAPRAMYDPVHK